MVKHSKSFLQVLGNPLLLKLHGFSRRLTFLVTVIMMKKHTISTNFVIALY